MSIADLQRLGWLPLRHHADIEEGSRNVLYGLRFDKHDTEAFKNPKVDDLGDLQFYHYWPKVQGKRDMGAWSNASPVVIVDGGALPILDDSFDPDKRLKPQEVTPALGRVHAKRTPGIVLGAMNEKEEQKLFFPTGGPMVAHHSGPTPPLFSADVYDITGGGELSDLRKAGLHSAFWVKFLPQQGLRPFGGQPAIAWNLSQSRGDFSGHGLIVAPADVSTAPPLGQAGRGTTLRRAAIIPPADILAMTSVSMSGPLHPGHLGDKHRIGTGVDGSCNAAHISTNAYFYRDQLRDAPLAFEIEKFPAVQDKGFPHLVHRRYDPDASHTFLGQVRKGLWREYVNIPLFVVVPPDDPGTPTPPPDYPGDPVPPLNPGGGKTPGGGGKDGGKRPGNEPDDSNPIIPPGALPQELVPIGEGFKSTPDFIPGGSVRTPGTFDSRTSDVPQPPYPNLTSPMKMQIPGIAMQAQPARTNDRYGKHNPAPSDKFVDGVKGKFPITAQIESFGHERTPGQFVRDTGRDIYPSGTGKGGILISPPQIGMRDYPGNYRNGSGIAETTVDVVFHREKVRAFFGTADSTIGEGINGVGMFLNSSQNLQVGGVDELGASDESKFVLFNQQVSVQGSAPNLWVWNTDSGTDVDSGYQLFAGKTASSNRTMRLKMTHHASNLQELGIFDGTTQVAGVTEDSALRLKETAVTPSDVSGWGNFFVKSSDSLPYFRDDSGTEYDLTSATSANIAQVCQGRLTLASGDPVPTSDQSAKSVVYFTPYKGNKVSIYNTTSSEWEILEFSEISLSTTSPSIGPACFDVFLYNNSGTVTMEFLGWTGYSTRATAITLQNGVYVKSGDASRKYVGTLYSDGSTPTELCYDTEALRGVWNYYNRVPRRLRKVDGTSHTYTTNAFRYFNNDSANKVYYTVGVAEDQVFMYCAAIASTNTAGQGFAGGIGLDSSTVEASTINSRNYMHSAGVLTQGYAIYYEFPTIGSHYLALIENGTGASGTTTWSEISAVGYMLG